VPPPENVASAAVMLAQADMRAARLDAIHEVLVAP
jgi:hypothetical protein